MIGVVVIASIIPLVLVQLFHAFPMIVPAFAQELDQGALDQDRPRLNATDSNIPVLEAISEKGIFRVMLKWPEVPLNPSGGIDIQIVFLNASAPEAAPGNVPQRETNFTGQSRLTPDSFVVPEILERRVPVDSYDLAVYSEDGDELWRENNRAAAGGTGDEHVILPDYFGPVTISIENIVPGWDVQRYDIETASNEELTDAVSFQASVVPEFPFIVVPLAIAMSVAVIAMRLKKISV